MKAAYNQNNLELYPIGEIYEDPCDNCIFLRPEKYTCALADFGENKFDEIFNCFDNVSSIFTQKPLSNIFEL